MPQLFPNAFQYMQAFRAARKSQYDSAKDDFYPRAAHGYGYQQIAEADRESLYESVKDLVLFFGNGWGDLLVPEDHATPERAVQAIVEYRDYLKRDLLVVQEIAEDYPTGRDQPFPIKAVLGYTTEVIDMLTHVLGMEEVRPYVKAIAPMSTNQPLRYVIVRSPDPKNIFETPPLFGVEEETMLALGRKFLEGGGKVMVAGKTYSIKSSTFLVFEMDQGRVGSDSEAIQSFFERTARARKQGLRYDEALFSEFGKDVTHDVLKQLEGEKKVATVTATPATAFDFWSLLHPRVGELCRRLFMDGHRKEAVQAALTEVDQIVSRKYRAVQKDGKFGTAMMAKSFAKDAPVIQLFRLDDPMYGDMQEGYMHLFMGVMQAMRNPKSHSNFQIDERDAIELLFLTSRLLRKIDEAVKP